MRDVISAPDRRTDGSGCPNPQKLPGVSSSVGFHDHLAAGWEAKYQRRSFRSRVARFEGLLADRELAGMRWLDAGCGTGVFARMLVQRGCSVLGVDASLAMVDRAERHPDSTADRLSFQHVETVERLTFEDRSFDGALCSSVLEYLDNPTACCQELARVLRPGGLLLVSVPNRRSLIRGVQTLCFRLSGVMLETPWFGYLAHSKHAFSAAQFDRLLDKTGFRVLQRGLCGAPIGGPAGRWSCVNSLLFWLAERQ